MTLNSKKLKKVKKILKGKHRNFILFVIVSTSITFMIMLFGPGNNLFHWAQARWEISRQEKQIRIYKSEIERMDKRIKMLNSNRDTLEKFAREELHFAAPGEDVYLIEE